MQEMGLDGDNLFSILFHLHEGVTITDVQGVIRYYNQTMADIDEMEIDDVMGRRLDELYRIDDRTFTTMAAIQTGQPVKNKVVVYRTRLGKLSNVVCNVFPLFKSGRVVGAITFTKDYQMLASVVEPGASKQAVKKDRRSNGTRYCFDDIVGQNGTLLHAVKTARMASGSPSPIMLSGETGTGKELFAQSIHNCRNQGRDKFIPVNCAAIPENLLEGILFGTSKGAFTGAIEKPGLFEQADGGTIFLDELDSMPQSLQAKVLRVVQEKKVRRLGSLDEVDLDIKIISAVGRDLRHLVGSGALRQDLFYRMGVVFILLPPLRKRPEDLDPLVRHFIRQFNLSLGENVKGLSHPVTALFKRYSWPGNVRELEHVIEGAMNMVNGAPFLHLDHLPPHVRTVLDLSRMPSGTGQPDKVETEALVDTAGEAPFVESLQPTLTDIQNANERKSLCNALAKTHGNAAGAARLLGISPQSLHYKLKKYRIDRKTFLPDDR